MKIRNVSDGPRVIADTGDAVEPDGTVVVNKQLGDALCQQEDVWQKVQEPKSSKGDD